MTVPRNSALRSIKLNMEDEMLDLYQAIDNKIPQTPKKIIQFMGTNEEEGTSTIVQQFAMISVLKFNKTVLLLDAGVSSRGQHEIFNVDVQHTVEDTMVGGGSIYKAFYQISSSTLFLSKIFKGGKPNPHFLTRTGIDGFLGKLKNKFDLLLIDSPPASTFSFNLATSSVVNGVAMVVEAEKTRWPVVDSARKKIVQNGGNVLGVVLNKRRYHIPEFIYKRL